MPADVSSTPAPRAARSSARADRFPVLAAVFLGGALGTLARAGLVETVAREDPSSWPWATLTANVAGALLLGWWATRSSRRTPADPRRRPFLTTGICGGLTTFSTLQVEAVELVRAGAAATAAAYLAVSVTLGLLAVIAGRAAAERAAGPSVTVRPGAA